MNHWILYSLAALVVVAYFFAFGLGGFVPWLLFSKWLKEKKARSEGTNTSTTD